jgi:hypothetical protein
VLDVDELVVASDERDSSELDLDKLETIGL